MPSSEGSVPEMRLTAAVISRSCAALLPLIAPSSDGSVPSRSLFRSQSTSKLFSRPICVGSVPVSEL